MAIHLGSSSRAGALDTTFYVVQAVELAAGGTNLVMLGRSLRDGWALTKAKRRQREPAPTLSITRVG